MARTESRTLNEHYMVQTDSGPVFTLFRTMHNSHNSQSIMRIGIILYYLDYLVHHINML